MWSFAIWDDKEKVLFLSRDRFGEKPLFYMIKNDNFFFASELKSFVKLESINKPDFNYEYLNKFRDDEFEKILFKKCQKFKCRPSNKYFFKPNKN